MRITKNGLVASVPDDMAAVLIADKGWEKATSGPALPALTVTPNELAGLQSRLNDLEANLHSHLLAAPDVRLDTLVPDLLSALRTSIFIDPTPPRPTAGRGQREIEITSDAPGIEWMHTPQITDNFVVVFIGLTIPESVPGGSVWTPTMMYGDQKLTFKKNTLTAGKNVAGQANDRGHIDCFVAHIPPDVTRTPKRVSLQYKTGKVDTYTLRGNSFTFPRVGEFTNAAGKGGFFSQAGASNSANASRTFTVNSAPNHRVIGCSMTATPGGIGDVTGTPDIGTYCWRDDSQGRSFTVWTTAPGGDFDVTNTYTGAASGNYFVGCNGVDLAEIREVVE